jgi:AhpD family alkylhydroperoxidase
MDIFCKQKEEAKSAPHSEWTRQKCAIAFTSTRIAERRTEMTTVKLLVDAEVEAIPAVKAVFDDIRAVRKSDFVNNFWRGLANDPALLKRTWEGLKAVMMGEGALDPLVREMIYIAVSTANGCTYCVHSHTAAARAKGMTDAQHGELLAVIGLAGQTNHLVTAMQIPVDPEFDVSRR